MAELTKVIIAEEEMRISYVRSTEKVIADFGEDYLNEYGIEVPKTLVDDVNEAIRRLRELSRKLDEYTIPIKYENLCPILKPAAIADYMKHNKRFEEDESQIEAYLIKNKVLFTKTGKLYKYG